MERIHYDALDYVRCSFCNRWLSCNGGYQTISGPICMSCSNSIDNPPKPATGPYEQEFVLVRGQWFHVGEKQIRRVTN